MKLDASETVARNDRAASPPTARCGISRQHVSDISPAVLDRTLARLAAFDDDQIADRAGTDAPGPPVGGSENSPDRPQLPRPRRQSGLPVPERPVVFLKATTALSGPTDPVVIPRDAGTVDWEVELGIAIGRTARYVAEAEAVARAGYCVMNDVSERTFSEDNGGNWTKGKSCDTFGPMGPWLVTADEVRDPQRLGIWLEVNGRRYQDSNTANMVFGVAALIAYVSRFMTLLPGDVISSGTPGGVGLGQKPPAFLKAGDVMRLGIDGLGEQRLLVVPFSLHGLPR